MAAITTLLAFAETVRHASFAGAAREMGLSASAVAKSVARLEADLGLRLLHRTTRQVSLTADGAELYERCRRIVDDMAALREEAQGVRGAPRGTIRLNMPLVYGREVVVPRLAALTRRYPELSLDLSFSDRYVDLVREGLDGVVRIGALADSGLVARRIGVQNMPLVASPAYLKRRGTPQHLDALATHDCLAFRLPSSGRLRPWQFCQGKRAIEFTPQAHHVFDDGEALLQAAVLGMGLIQLPDYLATAALRAKRVVEVLPAFRPTALPISLVLPSARQMTPRIRVLVEALTNPEVSGVPAGHT